MNLRKNIINARQGTHGTHGHFSHGGAKLKVWGNTVRIDKLPGNSDDSKQLLIDVKAVADTGNVGIVKINLDRSAIPSSQDNTVTRHAFNLGFMPNAVEKGGLRSNHTAYNLNQLLEMMQHPMTQAYTYIAAKAYNNNHMKMPEFKPLRQRLAGEQQRLLAAHLHRRLLGRPDITDSLRFLKRTSLHQGFGPNQPNDRKQYDILMTSTMPTRVLGKRKRDMKVAKHAVQKLSRTVGNETTQMSDINAARHLFKEAKRKNYLIERQMQSVKKGGTPPDTDSLPRSKVTISVKSNSNVARRPAVMQKFLDMLTNAYPHDIVSVYGLNTTTMNQIRKKKDTIEKGFLHRPGDKVRTGTDLRKESRLELANRPYLKNMYLDHNKNAFLLARPVGTNSHVVAFYNNKKRNSADNRTAIKSHILANYDTRDNTKSWQELSRVSPALKQKLLVYRGWTNTSASINSLNVESIWTSKPNMPTSSSLAHALHFCPPKLNLPCTLMMFTLPVGFKDYIPVTALSNVFGFQHLMGHNEMEYVLTREQTWKVVKVELLDIFPKINRALITRRLRLLHMELK